MLLFIMVDMDNYELEVCIKCDAPLPISPKEISLFNFSNKICDDCILFLKR